MARLRARSLDIAVHAVGHSRLIGLTFVHNHDDSAMAMRPSLGALPDSMYAAELQKSPLPARLPVRLEG